MSNKNFLNDIFECKSFPDNYKKEESDKKRNHVMFTDDWDKQRWENFTQARFIIVKNTKSNATFMRRLTDKTKFKNIIIMSW